MIAARRRIELAFAGIKSGTRHHRELAAFASYCVARIERELGAFEQWRVQVAVVAGAFEGKVATRHRLHTVESAATAQDPSLAIWDAMCRIEEMLRMPAIRLGA